VSVLSQRLGSRPVLYAAHPGRTLATVAVAEAGVRVAGLGAAIAPEVGRRLVDLGLVPGASIEVLRKAPLGGPVIVRVANYEVALRLGEARQIIVDSVN